MIRKDNRIHPRLLVRIPAEYRVGNAGWHQAQIKNLSAGGATLISLSRIPPQTVLHVRFELPGEPGPAPLIEVETVVLRAETLSSAGGNLQYREALHFLDLVDDRYERVRRYVFERQQGASA